MKTKKNKEQSPFKNCHSKICLSLFIGIFVLAGNRMLAQTNAIGKEITPVNLQLEDEDNTESYLGRTSKGIAYIRWIVTEDRKDGVFIVQRSKNKVDYIIVGMKEDEVSQSPITQKFNYIDKNPLPGISYYRVLKVNNDGSSWFTDINIIELTTFSNEDENPPANQYLL